MGMRASAVGVLCCLWGALFPAAAAATTFDYVNLADTKGEIRPVIAYDPVINNAGTAAFLAGTPDGGSGIFVSNSGRLTTVATTEDGFTRFASGPAINDAGAVVFYAQHRTYGSGVFLAQNGTVTPLASSSSGPYRSFEDIAPSINNRGTVAFQATLKAGGQGIFTASNGTVTRLAFTGDFLHALNTPVVNDQGEVAFIADTGLFTYRRGTIRREPIDGDFPPSSLDINNSGALAFVNFGGSYEALGVAEGGFFSEVVDSRGPFVGFVGPALNDDGTILFKGDLRGGGSGLFTGPDPVTDAILRTGDRLFDSTVTDLGFIRGRNERGDFVFYYKLTDGTEGIAAAFVPEPAATPWAIATGLVWLYRSRRRSRAGAPTRGTGR